MNNTGIIWTEYTWNPVSGCVKVSAGCKFCYAETMAERHKGTSAFPNGFGLTIRPHKLKEPYKLKEPSLIFVNSMSDLFWEEIDEDYRDKIVDVIEDTPQHEYQVLTKRPDIMLAYSKRRKLPGNFWAGVTIENQKTLDRIKILQDVDAEIRFISFEPLLEDLEFDYDLQDIHWVITGGESGVHMLEEKWQKLRGLVLRDQITGKMIVNQERVQWIRNILTQCRKYDTDFFHKQWGGKFPKSCGRELDGEEYDEIPRLPGWNKSLKEVREEHQGTLI